MTIQEAIKSGRAFRRKAWDGWIVTWNPNDRCPIIEDILAEDWEIKQEPRGPREFFVKQRTGGVMGHQSDWICHENIYGREADKGMRKDGYILVREVLE